MKLFVDGEEVEFQNDVKVIYDDVCVDMDADTDEEIHGELHATLTNEGMILDLITTEITPDGDAEVLGTYATEYGEMATLCH